MSVIIESLLSLPIGAIEAPFSIVCLEADATSALGVSEIFSRSLKIAVVANAGIKKPQFAKMANVWGAPKGYGMAGFVDTPFGFCSIFIDKPEKFEILAGPPPDLKESQKDTLDWAGQAARRVALELNKAGLAAENAQWAILKESVFFHFIGESTPVELLQLVGEQVARIEQGLLRAETRVLNNGQTDTGVFQKRAVSPLGEPLDTANKTETLRGAARRAPRSL